MIQLRRFILILIMINIFFNYGCGIQTDYKDVITEILGESDEIGDVGVYKVENKGKRQIIYYRCNYAGLFGIKEETGSLLTGKIKELYETNSEIDNITFVVYTQILDKHGKENERKIISFDFSRRIYNKISTGDFHGNNLLTFAENVKIY